MNGTISSRRARNSHGDRDHQESSQERWLLTYADMITLLLVLFIVLYAISTIDQAKYQEFKQSVTRALLTHTPHGTTNLNQNSTAKLTNENTQANQQTNQLLQIEQELASALNAKGLLGSVTFSITSAGLVVGLVADSTFFGSDVADLTPQGMEVVDTSAGVLKVYPNAIEVAGYTDNVPITGGPYANNWVLSAARATSVVVRMTQIDGVNPGQVASIGYGQYHPLATNATAAGQSENRRVNIIVSPSSIFKP